MGIAGLAARSRRSTLGDHDCTAPTRREEESVTRDSAVRVYTRGTSLPVSTVENALRDQLGVEVGRVQVCGSSHIDMELKNTEDKKVEHRSVQVEGNVFHVGLTFSPVRRT